MERGIPDPIGHGSSCKIDRSRRILQPRPLPRPILTLLLGLFGDRVVFGIGGLLYFTLKSETGNGGESEGEWKGELILGCGLCICVLWGTLRFGRCWLGGGIVGIIGE